LIASSSFVFKQPLLLGRCIYYYYFHVIGITITITM
jgi:hypothetical protein